MIAARGPFDELRREHPDDEVVDLREGLLLPGFVDTHVHYPQVRAIGGLGMPLLDWLERCALPEEARLADTTYAAAVAADFVDGLARPAPPPRWSSGRTSRPPWMRCSPRPPGSG